jgi:hypothetical protein
MLTLKELSSVTLHMDTVVQDIHKKDNTWNIFSIKDEYQKHNENFDYLINAAGFRVGKIDDMINAPCKRMVEFKAAYVSKCTNFSDTLFPEIIFHGERGTPQGMGQFTPYPNGYVQLHGMTTDITLYEDGLVSNTAISCQPKLGKDFIKKIERSWSTEETYQRTNSAIKHLSQFIPAFSQAIVGSKPLFGAQQIPGDDPTLRVAEVSFPSEQYARCEIVKVSSSIDMIQTIIKEFIKLNYLDKSSLNADKHQYLEKLQEVDIKSYAESLAIQREYPSSLANRNISKRIN